jgi:hypothetical protein
LTSTTIVAFVNVLVLFVGKYTLVNFYKLYIYMFNLELLSLEPIENLYFWLHSFNTNFNQINSTVKQNLVQTVRQTVIKSPKQSLGDLLFLLRFLLLSLPNNVWRLIVFAPFLIIIIIIILILIILLSFRAPWTCPRQISGTTGQNFMKLGGVIDICF